MLFSNADSCPPLSNPTNGIVTFSMTANANNNYQSGTVATHECNDQFSLVGVVTRTCMDGDGSGTGVWTDSEPTCQGKPFQ